MSFTPRQQAIYRPLVQKAWEVMASQAGVDPADLSKKRAWYENELLSITGEKSSSDCGHKSAFELLMLHFSSICGDDSQIAYWSTAAERTMRHLILVALAKLSELDGEHRNWSYAAGIFKHMNLPLRMEDAPAESLHKVFQALSIQVQRKERERKARARVPDLEPAYPF